MTRKAGSIFTVFFLLYFVFYAMAPLSAALPRKQSPYVQEKQSVSPEAAYSLPEAAAPIAKAPDIKVRRGDHFDPFIFDMVLWNILKRVKPSDDEDVIRLVVKKRETKNFAGKVKNGALCNINVLPLPFFVLTSHSPASHVAFLVNTPLLYSGLSPPLA